MATQQTTSTPATETQLAVQQIQIETDQDVKISIKVTGSNLDQGQIDEITSALSWLNAPATK